MKNLLITSFLTIGSACMTLLPTQHLHAQTTYDSPVALLCSQDNFQGECIERDPNLLDTCDLFSGTKDVASAKVDMANEPLTIELILYSSLSDGSGLAEQCGSTTNSQYTYVVPTGGVTLLPEKDPTTGFDFTHVTAFRTVLIQQNKPVASPLRP